MLVRMFVVVAFLRVIMDLLTTRSLSRLRLGIILECAGRTQRFAFQARRGEPIQSAIPGRPSGQ